MGFKTNILFDQTCLKARDLLTCFKDILWQSNFSNLLTNFWKSLKEMEVFRNFLDYINEFNIFFEEKENFTEERRTNKNVF